MLDGVYAVLEQDLCSVGGGFLLCRSRVTAVLGQRWYCNGAGLLQCHSRLGTVLKQSSHSVRTGLSPRLSKGIAMPEKCWNCVGARLVQY